MAARVYKTFSEPALAVLWRRLDTMVPLVKLLSAAKLTERDDADPEDLDNAGLYGMLVSSMAAYRLGR